MDGGLPLFSPWFVERGKGVSWGKEWRRKVGWKDCFDTRIRLGSFFWNIIHFFIYSIREEVPCLYWGFPLLFRSSVMALSFFLSFFRSFFLSFVLSSSLSSSSPSCTIEPCLQQINNLPFTVDLSLASSSSTSTLTHLTRLLTQSYNPLSLSLSTLHPPSHPIPSPPFPSSLSSTISLFYISTPPVPSPSFTSLLPPFPQSSTLSLPSDLLARSLLSVLPSLVFIVLKRGGGDVNFDWNGRRGVGRWRC